MKRTLIETNEDINCIIDYLNKQSYLRDGAKVKINNCGKIYLYDKIGKDWIKR